MQWACSQGRRDPHLHAGRRRLAGAPARPSRTRASWRRPRSAPARRATSPAIEWTINNAMGSEPDYPGLGRDLQQRDPGRARQAPGRPVPRARRQCMDAIKPVPTRWRHRSARPEPSLGGGAALPPPHAPCPTAISSSASTAAPRRPRPSPGTRAGRAVAEGRSPLPLAQPGAGWLRAGSRGLVAIRCVAALRDLDPAGRPRARRGAGHRQPARDVGLAGRGGPRRCGRRSCGSTSAAMPRCIDLSSGRSAATRSCAITGKTPDPTPCRLRACTGCGGTSPSTYRRTRRRSSTSHGYLVWRLTGEA